MNRHFWMGTGLGVLASIASVAAPGCGGATVTASCIACLSNSDCTFAGESCVSGVCVPEHFAANRCAAPPPPPNATSSSTGSSASSTGSASGASSASGTASSASASGASAGSSSGSSSTSSGGSGSSTVGSSSSTSSSGSGTSGGSTSSSTGGVGSTSSSSSSASGGSSGSTGSVGPIVVTLGQNSATTNTVTVTLTQGVPAGWLVVAAAGGGEGAVGFTVTDSAGNAWGTATQRRELSGRNGDAVAGISFAVLTQPLSAGDTIVATFGGGAGIAKALSVVASPDFRSLDTTGDTQTQSGTGFSVSTAANLSSGSELVVGAAATDCATAPLSFTLANGFSELQTWSAANGSGVFGQLSGDALSGKPAFGATASAGSCAYVATVAAFEPGAPASPTALSLSHAPNAKGYAVSFTGGRGNGGPGGCLLQYQETSGTWRSDGAIDCDANAAGVSASLPTTTRLTPWTSAAVRLIRGSDGAVLGPFPQALTCSPKAGSSVSTPTVDEDCDGAWDNTTCTTFSWSYQQTIGTTSTACTNSQGTASTYACTSATVGQKRYTDGQSQALNPSQVWSSDMVGTACQGSYTGAVEWLCVASNCTYH